MFVVYSLGLRHSQPSGAAAVGTRLTAPKSSGQAAAPAEPPSSSSPSAAASARYTDGSFIGSVADAFYGMIQVEAVIQGGKISNVQFLQYPNDQRNSLEINRYAMPILKQEAIQSQNAQVDAVSGATDTSQAFQQSLAAALQKASRG